LLGAAVLVGCAQRGTPSDLSRGPAPTPVPQTTRASGPAPTTTLPASTITPTSTAAPVAVTTAPAFVGTISLVTSADVPYSYRAGCPVGPAQLRRLALSYWGFDHAPHIGAMIVNTAVTQDAIKVFATLYAERFPIRQMQPVDAFKASDPASMAADNTSGFNCRLAVAAGPPQWSVHAYGEAIDVNTVENPYIEGGTVQPAAGSAYVNRANVRPGMAVPGGPLVLAFASAGWQWGGRWATPDYQHFSKTGG
jgi:D-alanyl-D-alanine carboxypeptidase